MTKITLIGSGSLVFTRNLCNDILLAPSLRDCTIMLMDVDPERLDQSRQIVQAMVDHRKLAARVETSMDRKDAVRDASYVITTFQQGGLDAYQLDIEIPQRYGVEQCVGDTLGPGGVFRALRTIPVLTKLCLELDDVAPDSLLLNYVNPMAANCWAVDEATGRPHVGLCHSVQGTSEMLAEWIGVPYEEVTFYCAGINHQAFFLDFRRGAEDLYPLIWGAIDRPEIYGQEPVRIELMKAFGYFVTESSGHASEYVPYFRKSRKMVEEELVPKFTDKVNYWFDYGRTGGYLRHCFHRMQKFQNDFESIIKEPPADVRSHEYGSYIIEAIESNTAIRINGNVPNTDLIENLPRGCCVEVPCLIDGNGIQPTKVGLVPPQLAALNRTNINVQELIVEAALTGDVDAVYHAVTLDPLTAAVCTLPQIRSMVDEMLTAQEQWLPQF
ncbi:MAG: alpha-glucosidase/alpha-galactosidase [Verrucomicrobia bacterium]|nr:alpha-glucosidase/alpha-galactosidase [Verrucomicrobiota bacterium]MBV9673305.1 alpha-glucosidase/alpha-galactosidase [Verrucomicrobiota bacterium]